LKRLLLPRPLAAGLSFILAVLLGSCGEAVVAPAVVREVAVSGGGAPLRLSQSAQLGVTLRGDGGVTLPTAGVTWTSSDASVATVSASGQVTAVKRGSATISASAGGVTGTAAVPVIGVQRVDATPDTVAVIITQAAQLSATVTADPGVTVTPTWVSRDTTLATVTAAGRVTAKSALGVTYVVATAEDQRDSVKVRVIPVPVASVTVTPAVWTLVAGQTVQLLATTKDSVGGLLSGRVISWSSSDTAKAVVNSGGLVTSKAAGAVTITATSEGKSASTALTVLPPVATVALSADTLTLILGKTGTLTATPKAADGTSLERAVSWSVLDTLVGTVATDGVVSTNALVTAKALGTTTVTATSEGKSKSAVLKVIAAPVASVAVTPQAATLVMGKTLQLSAVPKDAEGNALGGRTITWTSSDVTKATVSTAGLVTARTTGVVTVTATSEGKSGTMELTVVIPVATVTVTAVNPAGVTSLLPGQTVQLAAVAKDSLGNTLSREILWSSSNGLVATVSVTGLVTPTGNGTATILATSEGVTGTIVITAAGGSGGTSSGGTVAAIAVLPTAVAVVSGDTASVAFRPTDASGAVVVQTGGASFVTGPVTVSQTQVTSGTLNCATTGLCTQRLSTQGVASGAPAVAVPLRVVPTNGGAEGSVTAVVVGTVADSLVGSFVPASVAGVPSVAVGDTVQIRATLYTAAGAGVASNARFTLLSGGADLAPCTVGWGATQVQGGCVKVVARAAGAVKVIASLPQLGGSASWADTLEVTAGTAQVRTITIEPTAVTLGAGQSSTLTATLKDDFSNVLTGRIVTWTSSDPAIATVDAKGVVTGVKPGTTTVLAQSGAQIATVTVTVVSAFNLRDQGLALGGNGSWEGEFTCALDQSSKAWCWGSNVYGQLGDGTGISRQVPTLVAGDITFTNIAAGTNGPCALSTAGDIYCWGAGWNGQLGNGTTNSSNIPVLVSSSKKFRAVTAGQHHFCAVSTDEDAYCWGTNWNGQLGNGESGTASAHKSVPTLVSLGRRVQAISAMASGGCVLTVNRETYCWGENGSGQVGNGTNTQSEPTPKNVLGGYEFEAIAGGGHSMCGQMSTGTSYCWGQNNMGQLFQGGGSASIPQAVLFGGVQLRSLGLGQDHICGTTADGTAYCAGGNDWGRLGSATPNQTSTPQQVTLGGAAIVIVPGFTSTCAVLRSGGIKCWGSNDIGQLGTGTQQSTATPTRIQGDPQFASLSTGNSGHKICGLDGAGKAYCWGMWAYEFVDNVWGVQSILKPTQTAGILAFSQLTRGSSHQCGIRTNGETWCWGGGWNGQRGDGMNNSNATPSRVNTSEVFTRIAAGRNHTCAINAAGATYCWGENWSGQIGDGSQGTNRLLPVRVNGVTLMSIGAGEEHSCGLTADGTAYCWGANNDGQLGDGTTTNRLSPTLVALNLKFSKLYLGPHITCGIVISPAGKLFCWGRGWNGALGNGASSGISTTPSAVNSSLAFSSVTFGWEAACALTTVGETHCWGRGVDGLVGTGVSGIFTQSATNANSPIRLVGDPGFVSLSSGYQHMCGVTAAKVTYCWGRNRYGGLTADAIPPTTVSGNTVYRGSR
jgi:alpha-tubulin suppressor-like RCC1 family protein/uncharacterized protein YjdB